MGKGFRNRRQAGQELATELELYRGDPSLLILSLPRGGVPIGYEVAMAIQAPLDIFIVRKLGVPGQEELAFGAISSGGIRVLNEDIVDALGLTEKTIASVSVAEERELMRREKRYREDLPSQVIEGRTVVLVDDGLATGATMRAAVKAVRAKRPDYILVAIPVAARETCDKLREEVDEIYCLSQPHPLRAVGLWYEEFPQVTDEEVRSLLHQAADRMPFAS